MSIEQLRNSLLESGKDIKLNLSTILTEEGAPDLTKNQIGGIALASSYATKNSSMIQLILSEVSDYLIESEIHPVRDAGLSKRLQSIADRLVATLPPTTIQFLRDPGGLRRGQRVQHCRRAHLYSSQAGSRGEER